MRVYVAGLYSRNEKGEPADTMETLANIHRGMGISALLIFKGYNVFAPWLDHQFAFYQPHMPKSRYQENSMAWLEVSDCMLVISGHGVGHGVDREIERAEELSIPVFYSIEELEKGSVLGFAEAASKKIQL